MRVTFWGTRGSRPTPGPRTLRYGGNTTCVEVRPRSGELVILDSGSGIAELGGSLPAGVPVSAHLFISHTHWDHIQGFPFFGPALVPGSRLTVFGPGRSIKPLQDALADQMAPAYFPLNLVDVPAELEFIELEPGQEVEIGSLRIVPHELNHPIATLGYRCQEAGRAFVFATDNEVTERTRPALVEWAQGADLLLHDAQYAADEYPNHLGWGHSTFEDAIGLAGEAGARRLAFFHHDPGHSDADLDAMAAVAIASHQRAGGRAVEAFPAAEGQRIEV